MTTSPNSEPLHELNASKAMQVLNDMRSNLDQTALEIERGEFSQSGAGLSGMAFRSIVDLENALTVDIWSTLIALGSELWDRNRHDATISLIEMSYANFAIPDEMRARIENAIRDAKDQKTMLLAEDAFTAGDEERATRIAAQLANSNSRGYADELSRRIQSKHKVKKTALWVAGSSIASLTVMAIIGAFSVAQIMKEPPRPQMPSFRQTERLVGDIFASSKDEIKDIKEAFAEALPQKQNLPSPKTEMAVAKPLSATEPSGLILKPGSPPAVVETEIERKPEQPAANPEPSQKNALSEATRATREQCILGLAALQKASGLLAQHPSPETAKRKLAGFMSTLQDACSYLNLDPVALSLESGNVDQDRALDIAKGILQ